MSSDLIELELLIALLLLIAALVAWITNRLRFPYTVGLVLAGLAISVALPEQLGLAPDIARELILFLLLPPLVFEAALHIEYDDFVAHLPTTLTFAVPGVIITTALVGWLTSVFTGIPLPAMLVFGALIAATDPVAVIAIFRELGLPRRLGLLVESESLLNDATAIVAFGLMLEFALHPADFSAVEGAIEFIRVAAVGGLIGLVLGWVANRLLGMIDDYLIETALSAVLAFGVYLLAEQLHASGVLAVVVAGILTGNQGTRQHMSETTRSVLIHIWEFLAFLANSFVFLVIGIETRFELLVENWPAILLAIVVVLGVRAVVVFGLSPITNRFARSPVPPKWQAVLLWGGLRGGIALALAFTLPSSLPGRDTILAMTFGVVLFTLIIQATTLSPLLRLLGLLHLDASQEDYQRQRARLAAARAAEKLLETQHKRGLLSEENYALLLPDVQAEIGEFSEAVTETLTNEPAVRDTELRGMRRELLQAKRNRLRELYADGIITSEVYDELRTEVDAQLGH